MLRGLGWTELLIVLSILLLIFGPMKLPALGKAIGKTIRDFRQGMAGAKDDVASENAGETRAQ